MMSRDSTAIGQAARRLSHEPSGSKGIDADADQLTARIQAGDAEALGQLFSRYAVRLCGYAWHGVRSRAVAEELVQDVFLKLWVQRDSLYVKESIVPYLFRAVRNRVVNYLRHERVVSRHANRAATADASEVAGEGRAPFGDDHMVQRELHDAVNAAINALPERTREIFLLNRESGLTYIQIAQMLDISVKTVEYHMGRSFLLLRRHLADWTVT